LEEGKNAASLKQIRAALSFAPPVAGASPNHLQVKADLAVMGFEAYFNSIAKSRPAAERKEFAMKRQKRTRGKALLLRFACFDKILGGATS